MTIACQGLKVKVTVQGQGGQPPKKTKPGRDYVFSLVPVSQLSEVAAERFVVQAE